MRSSQPPGRGPLTLRRAASAVLRWTPAALAVLVAAAALGLWLTSVVPAPADARADASAGAKLAGERGRAFLVVGARPGDAWRWAGGTIRMLSRHNLVVVVVISSDAPGGDNTESGRAFREEADRRAAVTLGVSRVVFLRHPPTGLDDADVRERLAGVIAGYSPDTVLAFDAEHPSGPASDAARLEAGRVARACARAGGASRMALFGTSAPDTAVDIRSARLEKADALASSPGDPAPLARAIAWAAGVARDLGFDVPTPADLGATTALRDAGVEYAEMFRASAP